MTPTGNTDVIVVGGGPAGWVVSCRLAAAGRRVTLFEAGPGLPLPPSALGLDVPAASSDVGRLWPGLEIGDRVGGPTRPYRQARTLGGGSVVNGMVLSPGAPSDFETWRLGHGCEHWGWEQMAPALAEVADRFPLATAQSRAIGELIGQAARADGVAGGATTLDPGASGVLTAALAAESGENEGQAYGRAMRRRTVLDAFGPEPDGFSPDLIESRIGVPVDQLLTGPGPGRRVRGVLLSDGSEVLAPLVVLCAGALGSPALLWRSGLLPEFAGQRLFDHPSVAFTLVGPQGAAASAVSTVVRFAAGDPGLVVEQPSPGYDIEVSVVDSVGCDPNGVNLSSVIVALTNPESTGRLQVGSGSELGVTTGALTTERDRQAFRNGVRRVARWLGSGAVSEHVSWVVLSNAGGPGGDARGGPANRTGQTVERTEAVSLAQLSLLGDRRLDRALRARPGPVAHLASTLPLGPPDRADAVAASEVGHFGEIHGVAGLRVADSSVLPGPVSGGLQLTTMAVALRVADDVVGGG